LDDTHNPIMNRRAQPTWRERCAHPVERHRTWCLDLAPERRILHRGSAS